MPMTLVEEKGADTMSRRMQAELVDPDEPDNALKFLGSGCQCLRLVTRNLIRGNQIDAGAKSASQPIPNLPCSRSAPGSASNLDALPGAKREHNMKFDIFRLWILRPPVKRPQLWLRSDRLIASLLTVR